MKEVQTNTTRYQVWQLNISYKIVLKPVKSILSSIYKGFKRLIFKIRACSSVDRAVVSGTILK
nr:MAG TPA: hypothetical protein [Caudoviricetes sp.]